MISLVLNRVRIMGLCFVCGMASMGVRILGDHSSETRHLLHSADITGFGVGPEALGGDNGVE